MTNVTEFPVDARGTAPAIATQTHPLFWSIRRELWENRSLYIAPSIAAALYAFGFALSTITLPHKLRTLSTLDAARQQHALTGPYGGVMALLVGTAFLVGAYYCSDALYSERRDRSILFWKSLPVSDLTTVLSKAMIPLVVLPALVFALTMVAHLVMVLTSSVVLIGTGSDVGMFWERLPLQEMSMALVYALITISLWHAPIYAWLLLISSWAKRAVLLWAVLPFLALGAFEHVAFGTKYWMAFLGYRFSGWYSLGFKATTGTELESIEPLDAVTAGRFLTTPGLWVGLIFTLLCLTLAVLNRRNREAI